jgi:hypothetical protein
MNSFWYWMESQKVSDYLGGQENAKQVEEWLLAHPQVRDFLAKIDAANLVKPEVGKKGYLVLSKPNQIEPFSNRQYYSDTTGNSYQHRIPVNILKIQGNEAEIERMDGKNFDEITYKVPHFPDPKTKRTILVPLSRISIVKQDQYQTYLKWLVYAVKKGAQDANMSIPKFFTQNWNKVKDQLIASLDNSQLQSKFRTTELGLNHFNSPYPEAKKYKGGEGASGRTLVEFPNGFRWVALDKESCEKEGDAGGHCGNAGDPRPGDNVLSLRDKNNRVYLTFILNNGELSERKANGNKKPPKELHPYIIKLLELPIIENLGPGKYLTENDFQITDLDHENLIALGKTRPDLVKGISKIDFAFSKYANKPGIVVKKLNEKYPDLEITGYDKDDRALILGYGEFLDRQKEEWKQQSLNYLEFSPNKIYDIQALFDSAAEDYPPKTYAELTDYFRKSDLIQTNIDDYFEKGKLRIDIFRDKFIELYRNDKNFKHFIKTALRKSYEKNALRELNEKLKNQPNEDGFYYKVLVNGYNKLAYKQIPTNEVKSLGKNPNKEINPHIVFDTTMIPTGDFVEAVNDNLKMLYYPG